MKLTKTKFVKGMVVLGAALLCLSSAAYAQDKPNVILLITDDMGWGDPGSYGFDRGVETPNLDRVAKEGMRFTNWYAEASCTPGRAAIQTGRIPMRSALTVALGPGDKNKLRKENRTIAEFYATTATRHTSRASGTWAMLRTRTQ